MESSAAAFMDFNKNIGAIFLKLEVFKEFFFNLMLETVDSINRF